MIDATFIIPNNAAGIYQSLSSKFAAIETPTWALLLAQSCRSKGFKVSIIDTLAENLSDKDTLKRIENLTKKILFLLCMDKMLMQEQQICLVQPDYLNL